MSFIVASIPNPIFHRVPRTIRKTKTTSPSYSSSYYSNTSNRLKETTKKALIECDPKKKHFTMMTSECVAIWSEVEELIERMDTIQKMEELDDLDFKI